MRLPTLLLALSLLAACGEEQQSSGPPALPIPLDNVLTGVFEGRVPSTSADREKIKVRLMLSHDPISGAPTTATLEWVPVPPDAVVRHVHQGTWTIQTGTPSHPDAVVYLLDDAAPEGFGGYMAIGPDLLLLLNDDLSLRIGNASWSYTLSRTR
jgi:hypothetical protein